MTKLKKIAWAGGFAILMLMILLISVAQADNSLDGHGDFSGQFPDAYYNVDAGTSTGGQVSAKNWLINIINRSGKNYFVPNNSVLEWESFADNHPKYVSISECGDGVCGEGESVTNCTPDCQTPVVDTDCGNGICHNTIYNLAKAN